MRQWTAACEARLKNGQSPDELTRQIVEDGYSRQEARQILDQAAGALNRRAGGILGCSAALLVAGLAVTLPSLHSGVGFIWWGAILCGGIGVVYGLCALVRRK